MISYTNDKGKVSDQVSSYLVSFNHMAMKCMNCGKGVMYGHNVSHAKNRTNRLFKPNLHWARIPMGAMMKRVKLCTKCLRMIKRSLKEEAPVVATA